MRKILNKLNSILIYNYCLYYKRLDLGKKVLFKNKPYIIRHNSAKIEIGYGSVINSTNRGYHLNMFSKCKLYADRPNAEIKIGINTRIHGACIHAYSRIIIGDNCLVAANTQIIDGNGHQLSFDNPQNRINTTDNGKPIIIEDNVWIGANCMILGGAHIGSGSVIAAGSIVKSQVPPRSLYVGNPGNIIKQY